MYEVAASPELITSSNECSVRLTPTCTRKKLDVRERRERDRTTDSRVFTVLNGLRKLINFCMTLNNLFLVLPLSGLFEISHPAREEEKTYEMPVRPSV